MRILPRALKTLVSIKPDVKQRRRMGIDVDDLFTLRVRNALDIFELSVAIWSDRMVRLD